MFSEQSVIDLLIPTAYEILEFPDVQYDVFSETDTRLPRIYVGYSSIDSTTPNAEVAYDFLHQHGENLIQSFDIHIVCNKEDLPDIFKAVHGALVGKIPVGQVNDTISLTFALGGLIGKNNGIIHWLSRYKISFPTLFTLY